MFDDIVPSGPDHEVLRKLRQQAGPFRTATALEAGATYPRLREWVSEGLLCHPVRGVYHSPLIPDTLSLRIQALRLIVPADCVVTDRTAGWLWGADMILAPGDHLATPAASVFCPPGKRLRNGLVASGERFLTPEDVAEVDGLQVTTALRTACDLGRLLHRSQALAALDSLMGLNGFSQADLCVEAGRFVGYRGVVQLRALSSIVDQDAKSPGESALRLHWLDAGLPRPRCQVPVPSPTGGTWWLDMGLERQRFAAEYDGEEFHGEEHREHDEQRREWLRAQHGWVIVVLRRDNVFGRTQDADRLLRAAYSQCCAPENSADPSESF